MWIFFAFIDEFLDLNMICYILDVIFELLENISK